MNRKTRSKWSKCVVKVIKAKFDSLCASHSSAIKHLADCERDVKYSYNNASRADRAKITKKYNAALENVSSTAQSKDDFISYIAFPLSKLGIKK